jgi:anti-sigma B factor antagonist
MDFRLEVTGQDGWTVVAVTGEVDVATAPGLRSRLIDLINEGHHRLVVDLSWVDFIDSTGLGVLIGALKRVRSHDGTLLLVVDDPRVHKLFAITGLDQVFDIHPSLTEAVGS